MDKSETYAILKHDGKQYIAIPGSKLYIDRTGNKPGETIVFSDVLFYRSPEKVLIGKPTLKNVNVTCEVVKNLRGKKIIVFKKKRRKNYKKTIGHRQNYTELLVKEITVDAGVK